MRCPCCGGEKVPVNTTKVVERDDDVICKRYRICSECKYRFVTWESYEAPVRDDSELLISCARDELVEMNFKIVDLLSRLRRINA